MTDIVRIGGGSVALADSGFAAARLIEKGRLDYLVLDYLVGTAPAQLRDRASEAGGSAFVCEFVDRVFAPNLAALADGGPLVVTNAGGLDPEGCVSRIRAIAAASSIDLQVVAVGLPGAKANVEVIAAALAGGADLVVTGAVEAAALTLAPLAHRFGWTMSDADAMAGGSLAGLIVQCGVQAARGALGDWTRLPYWARSGYPIVECGADGAFEVMKLDGSAGQCTPTSVAQQILHEVGNPAAHRVAGLMADYRDVDVQEIGPERVRVTGARGRTDGAARAEEARAGAAPAERGVGAANIIGAAVDVPLFDLVWSHAGCDADGPWFGIVARRSEYLPFIRDAMTPAAVASFLARHVTEEALTVERHDFARICALSFIVRGQDGSRWSGTRLSALLDFPVSVPQSEAVVLAG